MASTSYNLGLKVGSLIKGTKQLGAKGLHEAQKKTAVNVLNKTQNKVSGENKDILDKARVLVVNKFADGGGVEKGLQIINNTDEFGEKYDVIVNGIKQGSISKSDEQYFAMSNSTRGGKPFPSKFFDNLDKAKKYIYSKTKTIIPLNSKSIMNQMGYANGGGIGNWTYSIGGL
jgi:hypothetical protein